MDLGPEPVILTLPNSNGRYYMVEILRHVHQRLRLCGVGATGYNGGSGLWSARAGRGPAGRHPPRQFAHAMGAAPAPCSHEKSGRPSSGAKKVLSEITTQDCPIIGQTGPGTGQIRLPGSQICRSETPRQCELL